MARARSPNSIKAEELFHKGWRLIDIAKELDVPEGTVRRWKSTQKWVNEKKQSERSDKEKANVRKQKNNEINDSIKPMLDEVESVMENDDLTDKQRLFFFYFIKCFNSIKAYQKAYEFDYRIAQSNGYRLLTNAYIKKEIAQLKQNRLNREMLDASDIFQKYMDIAFADISDYVDFGTLSYTYIDRKGEEKEAFTSYVRLKGSDTVDGTIVREVKMGKEGASIKLNDRMRALQWLADHMELATEEQRARIEHLRAQTAQIADQDKTNSIVDDWISGVVGDEDE